MSAARWVLFAAVSLTVASPLAGQELDWPDVGLGLIGDWTDLTPGARITLDWETGHRYFDDLPLRHNGTLDADLPFTLDPADNTESLTLEADYTAFYVWQTDPPGPMDPVRQLGYFKVGLQLSAEALQQMETADLSAGATFIYTHPTDELWWAPTLEADFGFVGCVGCSLPAGDDAGSWRVDVTADWSIPLAAVMPAPLDPLRLRPGGRLFKAWGMSAALEALRNEVGTWARIELAYTIQGVEWLHEIHVGWRGGELPVRLQAEEAWSVGATFVF